MNNFFILRSEASFLNNALKGHTINEIHTPAKDIVIVEFVSGENKKYLKISLEKNYETLFLIDNYSKPGKNVLSFLKETYGKQVAGIRILNKDRIIVIESENIFVCIVLVPGRQNVLLVKDNTVKDAVRNLKELKEKNFQEVVKEREDTQGASDLKKKYGYFGKHYYNEIISRAVMSRYSSGSTNTNDVIAESILAEIERSDKFYLYKDDSTFLSHIILKQKEFNEPEVFDSVNEILRTAYSLLKKEVKHDTAKKIVKDSKEKKIKALEKQISGLNASLKHAEDAGQYKESGDLILQNISEIKKGQKTYEFFDLISGKNRVIKLNPNLSPSENANQYFAKFKGLKKSTDLIEEKIRKGEAELENMKKQLTEVVQSKDVKQVEKALKSETKDNEKLPFRIFRIHEKFSVWVGKDSASNDLLTMKHSSQYDLWFHVRGASGSHTILKFEDKNLTPEKSLILKAAAIAAYYSKARNGRNVPVAYCERKYVRKKKGFKSGAVVMEKEKVVFVNPGLPPE
ncbi:MAG: NFACT RNA binding domain-containing protein [Bacteroidetes bacterium]|nr:NFACT RNA binding domain-containing protein [Bacteroidota bacterium]